MDLVTVSEWLGDRTLAALMGLSTGVVFGVAAQRSRFCLRAATVEFAQGIIGRRVSIWLLTFSTAVVWVQAAAMLGLFDSTEARMMAVPGSWSGAIIGGLAFGIGMVLARGCSGRLLVLAATGNMRSIVSGLVFAVVAQMSLGGVLKPLRDQLAGLWTTQGGRNLDLLAATGVPQWGGLVIGVIIACIGLASARRVGIRPATLIFASGVGFAVALGWALTYALSQIAFDPITVESATFTGPSAKTLMMVLLQDRGFDFSTGLVPGVFLGSFIAAMLTGEFRFQAFESTANMRQALVGAALMGFGGMLAGGCAIGAGVTGGSIFAGTAWLALFCMWIGAVLAAWVLHAGPEAGAVQP